MKASISYLMAGLSSILLISEGAQARGSAYEYLATIAEGKGRGDNPSYDCWDVPEGIKKVAGDMLALRNSCARIQSDSKPGTPIIVTDYSNKDGNVYVFNDSLSCVKQFDTGSWGHGGSGPGSDATPKHCSVLESNYSPAGLHLITEHSGEKYNNTNSFGMSGLDSQGSSGRGVLVHGGNPVPTSSTLGCLGLSDAEFAEFQKMKPIGGLIYSYFGGTKKSSDCSESEGYRPNGGMPRCDEINVEVPSVSDGYMHQDYEIKNGESENAEKEGEEEGEKPINDGVKPEEVDPNSNPDKRPHGIQM